MKPLKKVDCTWSPNLAYAIGLIATDGSLSKDGRHLDLTSKDEEQIETFRRCLGIKSKIRSKYSGFSKVKKYFSVQFSDVNFYNFLLLIGLTPAKSKTLGVLKIPDEYFADFLRGCIDGDGNICIFRHPESIYPQLRVRLFSASYKFLDWIHDEIKKQLKPHGWIGKGDRVFELAYGKSDTKKLLKFMYYNNEVPRLERKYLLARPFMDTIIEEIKLLGFTPPMYSS